MTKSAPEPSQRDQGGADRRRHPSRVEGSRRPAAEGKASPPNRSGFMRWWWLFGALLPVNWVFAGTLSPSTSTPRLNVPYSVFRTQVQGRNVATVTATGETIQLLAEGATVGAKPTRSSTRWWESLLLGFGPTLLLVGLFVLLMRGASRSMAGGGGAFAGFGKARARRHEPTEQRTTFKDVAGIDEATEELAEVVDCLKNPEHYRALGATVPRGVLLTGPPGTRETLRAHPEQLDALARALLEHETLDEPGAYAAAGIPHALAADQTTVPSPALR